jgi:hypothetical protein
MTLPRPRRLTPPAAPGELLKQLFAPPPRWHKNEGDHDPDYLADVRQCPCLHCGMEPSEAAHVRMSSAAYGKTSGLGKKPADAWALPLCAEHHRLARNAQHNQGEQIFWAGLGINPLMVCTLLHAQRGDMVAMLAVIFVAISERTRR